MNKPIITVSQNLKIICNTCHIKDNGIWKDYKTYTVQIPNHPNELKMFDRSNIFYIISVIYPNSKWISYSMGLYVYEINLRHIYNYEDSLDIYGDELKDKELLFEINYYLAD